MTAIFATCPQSDIVGNSQVPFGMASGSDARKVKSKRRSAEYGDSPISNQTLDELSGSCDIVGKCDHVLPSAGSITTAGCRYPSTKRGLRCEILRCSRVRRSRGRSRGADSHCMILTLLDLCRKSPPEAVASVLEHSAGALDRFEFEFGQARYGFCFDKPNMRRTRTCVQPRIDDSQNRCNQIEPHCTGHGFRESELSNYGNSLLGCLRLCSSGRSLCV